MVHASGNTRKASLASGGERARFSVPDGSLVTLLQRVAEGPTLKGVVSIQPDGTLRRQAYGDLLVDASRICAGLQHEGIAPGQRVLLQIGDAGDLIPAMWGCILAGAVPIPLNAALTYENANSQVHKLMNVWRGFGKPVILTCGSLLDGIRGVAGFDASFVPPLLAVDGLRLAAPATVFHKAAPGDTAVFFLTSGSTGTPKGVPQSHGSVLAMVDGTIQMNDFTEADATLNWMSLDHAGSLVFLGVMGVALKCDQFHAPISYVLQNPLRWLDLIHEHRITISWAPNFAFSLFLEKAEAIADGKWDLSCMRFMVNAGEAIVSRTARAFIRMLEQRKLPFNALRPAFGMVETCSGITWSTGFTLENSSDSDTFVDLGPCIPGASMRIVDEDGSVVPEGQSGSFQLKGPSVFAGYHNQEKLNSEIMADGWLTTGDLAFLRDGHLFITGREKDVIIVNGNNFYCHEIEGTVEQLESISRGSVAACGVSVEGSNTEQLALFYHCKETDPAFLHDLNKTIRSCVMDTVGVIPAFMLRLEPDEFPRTDIGKIQRAKLRKLFEAGNYRGRELALEKPRRKRAGGGASELADGIAGIWRRVLKLDDVGYDETFFELGGHSLLAFQVQMELEKLIGRPIAIIELFNTPTIRSMAEHFGAAAALKAAVKQGEGAVYRDGAADGAGAFAVVGVACRFPGADGPDEFWDNLKNGIESITFYTLEEAVKAGISPEAARNPNHVHAAPILQNIEGFDADFWKYSAREARLIDPQQRIFLETAWEAFEDAGYRPASVKKVGVFASAGTNTYLLNNIFSNAEWLQHENQGRLVTVDSMNGFNVMISNDKDYLPTRVSYKLDLTGPSINVQAACSSTLVAIHEACKSLRAGECDMALAGGCAAMIPQHAGHLFSEGMLGTPDGHCRAYDAAAKGTIFGSGSGAVLLKRLNEALADDDHIHAVIRGSAVCNDGGQKMGFTAPSMMGEYDAARGALDCAGVSADTIGFMEGHGTGTPLGDPIEVEALSKAFRHDSKRSQFCALGSVKTNIGHMGIASGIAGALKAILALEHRQIPATLHYQKPNPQIDFEASPFFVNTRLLEWQSTGAPRRAGVNSLGIGGTNAHVILEESPARYDVTEAGEPAEILPLSAKTPAALKALAGRYAGWLARHPDVPLRNICFTAQLGREHFACRLALVATGRRQLTTALAAVTDAAVAIRHLLPAADKGPVFLFTGQGAQYAGMAHRLYQAEPVFRQALDECVAYFKPYLEQDLLKVMFDGEGADRPLLNQTAYAQPALFAVQVALVRLLEQRGVSPSCLIGHSVGEFAAAWCAGVVSVEDAVKLVAARGRLMQALPSGGAMAAVLTRRETMQEELSRAGLEVSVAAWNSPGNQVISGPAVKIEAAVAVLRAAGITVKHLQVSHAFHSELMDPMLQDFSRVVEAVALARPCMPFISTVTGQAADEELATPGYWVRHARVAVRCEQSMKLALDKGYRAFIELGPHPTLCSLGAQTAGDTPASWQCCLRRNQDDDQSFQVSLAGLYEAGCNLDWEKMNASKPGRRVPLPTYPWQRTRHWIDADADASPSQTNGTKAADPLLGERIALPRTHQQVYRSVFDPKTVRMLVDHRVFGHIVPPGATYASQLVRAAIDVLGRQNIEINSLVFLKPMVVEEDGGRDVQVILSGANGVLEGEIISCSAGEASMAGPFIVHARARVVDSSVGAPGLVDLDALKAACPEPVDVAVHRDKMRRMRIDLGPSFGWLTSIHRGKHQALASLAPPEGLGDRDASRLHPGLIDAHWQVLVEAMPVMEVETVVPFCVDSLVCHALPSDGRLWCHAEWDADQQKDGRLRGNLKLISWDGRILIETNGLELRRADEANIRSALDADLAKWFYGFEWRPVASPPPQIQVAGNYLVVGGHAAVAPLAGLLRSRGASVVMEDGKGDREQVKAMVARVLAGSEQVRTVIFVAGDWPVMEVAAGCRQFLGVVQALVQRNTDGLRLVLLTHDCQNVLHVSNRRINVSHAPLWGMAASLMHEQPELAVLRIDLEDHGNALQAAADHVMGGDNGETQLAWRQGQFFAPFLAAVAPTGASAVRFSPDAVQVITGGNGGLGLTVAEWVVSCGARKLVLAGRSEPTRQATETLDALRKLGAEVDVVTCDVTVSADVQHLVDDAARNGRIQSVFHMAGIRDDGFMRNLDDAAFDRVLLPKLCGAWNLHLALIKHSPEFVVFFSSVASVFGSAGQASYAAGNAALDALAGYRRQEGLAALSINWGPWSDVGMAAGMDERHKVRLTEQGYRRIPREAGLNALAFAMGNNRLPRLIAAPFDRKRIGSLAGAGSLLHDLIEPKSPDSGQAKLPALAAELAGMRADQRMKHIEKHLLGLVGDLLQGHLAQQLDAGKGLFDLGMDSLTAVEMKVRLERDMGRKLRSTLAFDYPTIARMAAYLAETMFADSAQRVAEHTGARDHVNLDGLSEKDLADMLEKELG